MRITIIGTGNVAAFFGKALLEKGHSIAQLYGRNREKAIALAADCHCEAVSQIKDINEQADLYLIAVSDRAIPEIAAQWKLTNKLLVHTAGSVPIRILENAAANYGVLYPLQSINKMLPPLTEVPLLVNANTADNSCLLMDLAAELSSNVRLADDASRMKWHLAAVMLNNFGNFLAILTQDYCKNEGIDFQMLIPLIKETALRLEKKPANKLQTGPAVRSDNTTIERHRQMLADYPELDSMYEFMSRMIAQHFTPTGLPANDTDTGTT